MCLSINSTKLYETVVPNLAETEIDVPAYKRQGISIESDNHSSSNSVSRFTIDSDGNGPEIRPNNKFLHDNVD